MRFYKTINGIMNYIRKNANTGDEKTINDALMCGMGVYAYADIAKESGINISASKSANKCFYHFANETELRQFVTYLQKTDGHLCVQ